LSSALLSSIAVIGVGLGGIRYMVFGPRRSRRQNVRAQHHVIKFGLFERVVLLVGMLRRPPR